MPRNRSASPSRRTRSRSRSRSRSRRQSIMDIHPDIHQHIRSLIQNEPQICEAATHNGKACDRLPTQTLMVHRNPYQCSRYCFKAYPYQALAGLKQYLANKSWVIDLDPQDKQSRWTRLHTDHKMQTLHSIEMNIFSLRNDHLDSFDVTDIDPLTQRAWVEYHGRMFQTDEPWHVWLGHKTIRNTRMNVVFTFAQNLSTVLYQTNETKDWMHMPPSVDEFIPFPLNTQSRIIESVVKQVDPRMQDLRLERPVVLQGTSVTKLHLSNRIIMFFQISLEFVH